MKLSISNIAWNLEDNDDITGLLNGMGVTAIEIAPTKFWDQPLECSPEAINKLKEDWRNKSINFVAMQSLLFGQSHLSLFSDNASRQAMMDYMSGIIKLAGQLEVKSLVFGSPKNRLANSLSFTKQMEIAIPFFYELGSLAIEENVVLCIEPNPRQYGCDFITNSEEGIALVEEVGHPGFQLHLDSGALTLNQEHIPFVIEKSMPYLKHFHISEPYLELIGNGNTNHKEISNVLRALGYQDWVSIEMKNNLTSSNTESVRRSLEFTQETYS